MRRFLVHVFLVFLIFAFAGCYTQLQMADRSSENGYASNYDENYYAEDSTLVGDGNVYNYYIGSPYAYDSYYDPWYWDFPPRWGLFLSYSYSSWDPYWYPWGWYGRCCYPFLTAGYGYYYPGYYSGYPYYGYNDWYHYSSRDYHKRSWNRRSENPNRRIARGNTSSTGDRSTGVTDNRRIIRRSTGYATNDQTNRNQGHIVRSSSARRIIRSSGNTADRSSSRQGTVTNSRTRSSSHSRPAYRGPSRSSSGSSGGYTPRSSSRGSSGSRSAVRGSSGGRSSGSSGSRSSSSSSSRSSSSRSGRRH